MARANRFDQLIDAWDPKVRQAFLDSISNVRSRAQVDQIAKMLEAGDVEGALRAVGLDPVSFRPFDKTFEAAFDAGGTHTAAVVPALTEASGLKTVFQFNIRNPAAESWLRTYSSQLVTDILADQRTMIRNALAAGMQAGANPKATALDLVGRIGASGQREGGLIGLTDTQAGWVRNYASELASDNPAAALTRSLRDARFDATVLKAAQDKMPLSRDLIDRMVTAYKNRALRNRAETIARSETITALHQAQELAMQQAIGSGVVSHEHVGGTWRTANDSKVRDAHRELDGKFAKIGVAFQSSLGSIRFPGDPLASVANTANCRCYREVKIDYLAGIK
jgi:hypothetical protein